MKKITLLALLTVVIAAGCKRKQKIHTDHMHMRTMPGNDTLGCKDGRIWKQVGYDDYVDIGPVTDSCNCNSRSYSPASAAIKWYKITDDLKCNDSLLAEQMKKTLTK